MLHQFLYFSFIGTLAQITLSCASNPISCSASEPCCGLCPFQTLPNALNIIVLNLEKCRQVVKQMRSRKLKIFWPSRSYLRHLIDAWFKRRIWRINGWSGLRLPYSPPGVITRLECREKNRARFPSVSNLAKQVRDSRPNQANYRTDRRCQRSLNCWLLNEQSVATSWNSMDGRQNERLSKAKAGRTEKTGFSIISYIVRKIRCLYGSKNT